MNRLLNLMRREAMRAWASVAVPRFGVITHYDPNLYAVKVALQPGGEETGWMPLLSPWVGNNWGLFAAPNLGDQVEVQFQEGSIEAGFACLRLFNQQNLPVPVPAGEFLVQHVSGSLIHFKNDGSVEIVTAADLNATVGGNLNATVAGNATGSVTGNLSLTVQGSTTLDMQACSLTATSLTVTCPTTNWTGNINHVGALTTQDLAVVAGAGGSGVSGMHGTLYMYAPIQSDSDITTTGNITANGTNLHTHVHSGVQTGGGNTGAPV